VSDSRATELVQGVELIPTPRYGDERGWFSELRRESLLPKRTVQTNVSYSRQGVVRGLHYHERGQDDFFVCLQGMVRIVVLDRATDDTFSVDIGDDNPMGVWVPGQHAHGFEALSDVLLCYQVTREYDRDDPDEQGVPWDDPRVKGLWSSSSPLLSERDATS
jgi:dTDP-4-dehydrorhamnose 3,5-epimerase